MWVDLHACMQACMPAPMQTQAHSQYYAAIRTSPRRVRVLQSAYVCARCTSEKLQGAHTAAGATRHSATPDVQKSTLHGRAACRERGSVRDLQSTSAGCMRYDVRAVRTPWSRGGAAWPGEDVQSKQQYGRVGSERLRRCRGTQPGVRRSAQPSPASFECADGLWPT